MLEVLIQLQSARGHMTFKECFMTFHCFSEFDPESTGVTKNILRCKKKHFRSLLLHKKHGLPVILFGTGTVRVVCLQSLTTPSMLESVYNIPRLNAVQLQRDRNVARNAVIVLEACSGTWEKEIVLSFAGTTLSKESFQKLLGFRYGRGEKAAALIHELVESLDDSDGAIHNEVMTKFQERV